MTTLAARATFDHPEQQTALQEIVEAIRTSKDWVVRVEDAIEEFAGKDYGRLYPIARELVGFMWSVPRELKWPETLAVAD